MTQRSFCTIAFLALLAAAATARAEPPTKTRTGLVTQADRAVAEGRLADAREIWLQLWGIEPTPIRACQIGILSHDLGDYVEGARWLTRCERTRPQPKDPREREIADTWRAALSHARREIGILQIDVPPGTTVTVDGRPIDLNEPVFVPPGPHVVRAKRSAWQAEARVDVAAGETQTVLPKVAAEAAPGPRIPLVVAGGVAALGLTAAGVGLHLSAGAAEQQRNAVVDGTVSNGCFESANGACRDALDAHDNAKARAAWGTAVLVTGAATAAATVTYALWPRRSEVSIAVAGPSLVVRGTW